MASEMTSETASEINEFRQKTKQNTYGETQSYIYVTYTNLANLWVLNSIAGGNNPQRDEPRVLVRRPFHRGEMHVPRCAIVVIGLCRTQFRKIILHAIRAPKVLYGVSHLLSGSSIGCPRRPRPQAPNGESIPALRRTSVFIHIMHLRAQYQRR